MLSHHENNQSLRYVRIRDEVNSNSQLGPYNPWNNIPRIVYPMNAGKVCEKIHKRLGDLLESDKLERYVVARQATPYCEP